jgi:diacylglycerol O-acyltransferase
VPLPDVPLRLDRAPLQEIYPIAPLARGHALSVATATYHGNVHIGLLTDPAPLPRALRLADSITTAASTLLEASHLPRLPRVPAPVPS